MTVSTEDSHNTFEPVLHQNVDHNFTHSNRDQRCCESTLPDNLITADKGKSGVPAEDSCRKVEGGNDSDMADRIPLLHHEMAWPFTVENFAFDRT